MQMLKNLNAIQRLAMLILGILLSIFLLLLLRGIIEEKMYLDAQAMFLNQMYSGEYRGESGFRDLRWGAPSSELPGMEFIGKYTQGEQIYAQYRRAEEKLNFEGVPLRDVVYEFLVINDVELFFNGIMFLDNSSERYSKQIMEILDRRYGVYTLDRYPKGTLVYSYKGPYTYAKYIPYGSPYRRNLDGTITITGLEMYILIFDIAKKALKE